MKFCPSISLMTNPLNNFWETDLDGLPGAIN